MTTIHSKLSPSKRDRWSRCPASVREEAAYPDERSGTAAIDGTHTHSLLSHCIEKDVAQAASLIGESLTDHDGTFLVDAMRAERVQFALDYLDQRLIDLGADARMLSEVKVDLTPIFGRTDLNGTSDVVILSPNVIEIADYKDGMGAVEVTGNKQLNTYAWGTIAQLGIENLTQKTIRLTIIQPKLREKGSNGVYFEEMSMTEFLATKNALSVEAAACDDPNAPHVPGDAQCKYCRHKGSCSALVNQNMEALGIDFSKMNVVQDAVDKEPSTMTDQQIKELIEAAPLIRQMLEAVEKEALSRLDKGQSIEGLKLVRGRGSRSWSYDDDVMAEKLMTVFDIPESVIYSKSLISPAQTEKLIWKTWKYADDAIEDKLKRFGIPKSEIRIGTRIITPDEVVKLKWKKRDGSSKQLSEGQIKTLNDEYVALFQLGEDMKAELTSSYITKSDGKLQVAPASDERPAVVRDVSAMFSAVVAPVAELPAFLQVPDWLK